MKSIVPLLGWTLFFYSAFCVATSYRTTWELGRYYMPRTIVPNAAERNPGRTGAPVQTSSTAPTGEEEIMLGLLGIIALGLIGVGVSARKYIRAAKECQRVYEQRLRERSGDRSEMNR